MSFIVESQGKFFKIVVREPVRKVGQKRLTDSELDELEKAAQNIVNEVNAFNKLLGRTGFMATLRDNRDRPIHTFQSNNNEPEYADSNC